ncbi:MAG: hypothetical protein LBR79_05015 [Oscillospiraceae bacterium]|nr:hypothetical protein [Oscillospiraceae bacterium]
MSCFIANILEKCLIFYHFLPADGGEKKEVSRLNLQNNKNKISCNAYIF